MSLNAGLAVAQSGLPAATNQTEIGQLLAYRLHLTVMSKQSLVTEPQTDHKGKH